jgi:hypothetical protein
VTRTGRVVEKWAARLDVGLTAVSGALDHN